MISREDFIKEAQMAAQRFVDSGESIGNFGIATDYKVIGNDAGAVLSFNNGITATIDHWEGTLDEGAGLKFSIEGETAGYYGVGELPDNIVRDIEWWYNHRD